MDTRNAEASDAVQIAAIYNHFIRTSTATFEEDEVAVSEMASRIGSVQSSGLPWYVAFESEALVGYAYATRWKTRSAYRHSVEVTVYVAPGRSGTGVGTALYRELLPDLEKRGIHSVLAGIALPNPGSVSLHERFGFRKTAHFKQIGFKMGRWIDVGYWQLAFGQTAESVEDTSLYAAYLDQCTLKR